MQKHLQKLLLIVAMMLVPWVTQAQAPDPISTFPYTCDFEDYGDSALWVTLNGTQENGWYIGTAVNATPSGSYSLYVSNNSGTSNAYGVSSASASYSWAYERFTFAAGAYNISFNWKCVGEIDGDPYDYFRVFIVPDATTLTAGALPSTSYTWSNQFMSDIPTGWIGINGTNTYFCDQNTFTSLNAEFTIATAGTYKLVFLWLNDDNIANNPPASIDDITITENTCPRTSELVLDSISPTTASIHWTERGTATSWLIEYDSVNFVPGSGYGNLVVATSTSYTLTGLDTGTRYYVYVRALCGVGDTSESRSLSIVTPLTDGGLPFICNFESGADSASWTFVQNGQANRWFVGSATNNGGSRSMYISNDNGTTNAYNTSSISFSYAYKEFTLNAGSHAISYDWKCYGESNYDYIRVFLMPASATLTAGQDPTGGTSAYSWSSAVLPSGFISLTGSSTKLNLQSSWQNNLTEFYVPTSGQWRLVFAWANDGSGGSTPPGAIDNIYFAQPTCGRPADMVFHNITPTSFDVSWTETGSATQWSVQLDSAGTTIYSGVVYDTTASFTDLTGNTPYMVRVAAICDGSDTSMLLSSSFRTPCTFLDSLPYSYGFEDAATGTNVQFPYCWTRLNNGTSYAYYPYVASSTTYNHTPGGSKGLYWYNTSSSGYGDYLCLVMPGVDTDIFPINTLMLTFWAKASSSSYHPVFHVGVMTDPNDINTFTPVDTINVNGTTWTEFSTGLNNYTGTGNFIAVKAPRSVDYWYAYSDDYSIRVIPDCSSPDDLALVTSSVDTVTVVWNDTNVNNNAWQLAYGLSGFNPDTTEENLIDVTDTIYSFSNLIPYTNYDIYVRTDCGGDYSWWEGPLTVNPGSVNMPHSGHMSVTACNIIVYDEGGPLGQYTDNSDAQMTIYSTTPDSVLSFSGWAYTESSIDYLRIYDGTSTSGTLLWQTGTSSAMDNIDTIVSSSNAITLVWHTDGSVVYDGFELHVHCMPAPACNTIRSVSVTNMAGSSALLNWTLSSGLSGDPAYYEYEIYQGGILVTTDTTSMRPYWITGLTPGTNYKVRLRGICENEEAIPWDSTTFHTVCLAGGDIEITGGSSSNYYYPTNMGSAYSYTQEIFSASQLSGAATFTGMAYYANGSFTSRNIDLYLGETSQSSFINTSDYVRDSLMHLVYSGSFNSTGAGWLPIYFDSAFHYTGMGNIVVGFYDHTGSTGSSQTFRTDGSRGQSMHFHNSSAINPANPSGTTTYNGTVQNDVKFLSACDTTATCVAPNVIITSIGADEATIYWAPGLDETSWDLAYRPSSDTNWTIATTGWTTTTYTFTSLLSNVNYTFRVTPDCSDSIAGYASGTTACLAQPLPFTANFDSWTTGYTFPNCWYKGTNYSTNYPYVSTSYPYSGSKSLYMYSTNSTYSYIALPLMAAPIDSLQISFMLYRTNNSYPHALNIGVMSDPEDISTFTQLASAGCEGVYTWEPFEIQLNNYTGTGGYIAIVSPDLTYCYPYLDDLEVSYINPCPRPRNVYADDVTLTTATIHWVDTATNDFEIEYGPYGFAHGTGTVVTSNTDSVVISGLSANNPYDVYVRGICSPDTSNWSFCYSFRSACSLIDSLPWFDGMETYATGSSTTGSAFIPCYNRLNNGTSYGGYPYLSNSTTYNHTPGGSKGFYWYNTGTTGTYGDYQCIVLPGIDTTVYPINTVQLRFWAKMSSGSAVPTIQIGIMSDPTDITTFQGMDTVTVTSTSWTEIECPYTNFTGTGYYPAIKADRMNYWYIYVDDFNLEPAPSCSRPNGLTSTGNTANSVTLTWNERNSATEWEIAIETSASATPTADTLVTSNPLTISGLTTGTNYYFYVRSICGVGDTSVWSDVLSATPGSWNMRPNQTDTLRMCGGVIYDDAGTNQGYSNSQDSYIILYPDAPNNLVSVVGSYNLESCCDYVRIHDGISTTGTQLFSSQNTSSGSIGPLFSTNGPLTIYFHTDGSVNSYDGFTLNVSCLSTTCRVFNVHQDPSVPQSDVQLAVAWDTNGADYYEVAWGTPGFTPTTSMLTTYSNSAIITGLTGLTNYDVCVRSICSGGTDTGSWSRVTLQTAMCDNITEIYSYDSTMSTTSSSYGPIGYAFYNYSYVQTLIDSAQMAGLTDPISAFAFHPTNTTSSTYYTHMTVYMANVPESSLSGMITPDSNHVFVPVITDATFNFTDVGWQIHGFDTTFTWDGHSNVLFAVNRQHGSYSSSGTFAAHSTSSTRTYYLYQDSGPIGITYPSASSSGSGSYVGDIKFFSCGAPGCRQPDITGISQTYESATVTWTGESNAYEVNIMESAAPDWPSTDIAVTGNTYTFTGLQPATNYTFRVRQDCNADSLGYSEWTIRGFVTDSLPCLPPDSLTVSDITNATATFSWVPFGYETMWELHVWYSGGLDSIYTVSTNPATVGGFTSGVTYQAAVRPLCGSANNVIGDWGDTISFTAATCPDVTGLTVGPVTSYSVSLSWDANPAAQGWTIEYGYSGFDQGTGITVNTATNSYVVTGLMDDMQYDFHVRAICGTDWYSENWTSTSATTDAGAVTCDAPTGVSAVVAGNAATISWTPGAGNVSYRLEYGPRGFAHSSGTLVNATASPYTINNLDYETEYDVYVQANCGGDVFSAWSAVASFTTEAQGSQDCDPVSDLAASNVTENSALITWTPGNTGDEWEVVLTDAQGNTISEASTTEHQYQLNGLNPGTAYIAKVRTVCGDGQYSSFLSVSFTTVPVGIGDVSGASCTIYPNPTSASTTISVTGVSGKVRIAVVDMNGREVAFETLECSTDCVKTMDVEKLAQGAYFVRITGDNVSMVKKLIVR